MLRKLFPQICLFEITRNWTVMIKRATKANPKITKAATAQDGIASEAGVWEGTVAEAVGSTTASSPKTASASARTTNSQSSNEK